MRTRHHRLWLKTRIVAATCGGIIALLLSAAPGTPILIFNATGSAPFGFYYLEQRYPTRGELAVFRPPPAIEFLIVAHEILPVPVPLLKTVVGVGGDEICRSKGLADAILIDGKAVAEVQETDHAGRALPSWEGCLRLVEGEFFLLQPHPLSFDSRYFGPVLRCDILGVARPLWTWNPDI